MSVAKTTCAPPSPIEAWNQINWNRCRERVRKLQARIVKATQEGKWNKAKALQHLLTHSFSAKALAVKRVTGDKGKKILISLRKPALHCVEFTEGLTRMRGNSHVRV
jgi:RNA-directed DNA polymerase